MDIGSIHFNLLADSNFWSELITTLIIMLFLAIPAITKSVAQRNKAKEETQKLQGTLKSEKRRREGRLSDWDRRQQQIRERLNKLKEAPQVITHSKHAARTEAEKEPEMLPVAKPILETAQTPPVPVPKASAQPIKKHVPPVFQHKTPAAKPIFMQTSPAKESVVPKANTSLKGKKASSRRSNSIIEQIIQTSHPLKAGIILKEILDKPAAYRSGINLY